jgi:hypothetical protein
MREDNNAIFRQVNIRLERVRAGFYGGGKRAHGVFRVFGAVAAMGDDLREALAICVVPRRSHERYS